MDKRPLYIVLGLFAAGAAFAEAYTWTDENGIVHYSDRPNPNAKVIQLPESSPPRPRTAAPPTSDNPTGGEETEAAAPPPGYESIEIASPAAEETLWNIGGTLSVAVAIAPALQPGHQVRVYFDGTPQIVGGASFQLQEVYRGVHNLQVEVIDQTGKLMIRSRPSRFYVQQNSIL